MGGVYPVRGTKQIERKSWDLDGLLTERWVKRGLLVSAPPPLPWASFARRVPSVPRDGWTHADLVLASRSPGAGANRARRRGPRPPPLDRPSSSPSPSRSRTARQLRRQRCHRSCLVERWRTALSLLHGLEPRGDRALLPLRWLRAERRRRRTLSGLGRAFAGAEAGRPLPHRLALGAGRERALANVVRLGRGNGPIGRCPSTTTTSSTRSRATASLGGDRPCLRRLRGRAEHAFARPWCREKAAVPDVVRARGEGYRLGYAESATVSTWEREDGRVGLEPSAGGWDAEMLAYPCVFDAEESPIPALQRQRLRSNGNRRRRRR